MKPPVLPKVVLADDISKSLATWKNLLQKTCRVIKTAKDGPSALDAIRHFRPDVAVLDINMPGLSGLDVARSALAEDPHIGIVLCSVLGDPDLIQAAADAGVRGYVSKMDLLQDLAKAVAAVADGGSFLPSLGQFPCPDSVGEAHCDGNQPADSPDRSGSIPSLGDTEHQLRLALQAAEQRLRFEALVADISGRFVNLPGSKIDEEITNCLESICRSLGVDHASIFQVTDDPGVLVVTHLFRDIALVPPPEGVEAGKFFPWSLKKLMSGEIVNLPSTRNAPPEAAIDKQMWQKYQIQSTLAVPMVSGGGKLVGIWGFDSAVRERDWPETLQKQLKLLAEVFANAIDRKITERLLAEREAELIEAQRVAGVGSWTIFRNGALRWSDEMYRIHRRPPGLGTPTFKELKHLMTPESWESLRHVQESVRTGGTVVPDTDLEIIWPDGTLRWITIRGEVERNTAGQLIRVRGTAQDVTEGKEAERKLREYERAIEGMEEMTVVIDREYRYVIANRAYLKFRRLTADQVIGHHVSDIVKKDAFDGVIRKNLEESFAGQPVCFDASSAYPDQTRRVIFATSLPVDGPHGVERVVVILQDLTERKKAEEELRQRESELRQAQRIAHIGSWTWDPRTDEMDWSDEICAMTNWDRNVPVPRFREQVQFFPEGFSRLYEATHTAVRTGLPYEIELEGTRTDARKIWIIIRGEPVLDADGRVDHIRGTVQDITERHLAETAVKDSEERFRTIADAAPVMIWMAGSDGRASYVNKKWLEFTGTSFESQMGFGWAGCIHPEDAKRVVREAEEACRRAAAVSLEYRLRRHDGEYRWVIDSSVPWFSADGSFAGYLGSVVDDTERRATEEALRGLGGRLIRAQEEERKRIARELHDDINQRLAMLALAIQQLQSTAPTGTGEELKKLLKQTTDLSNGIQALSRKLHSSSLEYLGLAAAIRGFCDELERNHKVTIHYEHHDVPRSLSADISLTLFRITQEALQNAIKYSGVRQFTVWLIGSPAQVELTVRDEGVGFVLEDAMHGPGLGLVSMRERMAALHGRFSIASRPDHGTEIMAAVSLDRPLHNHHLPKARQLRTRSA